jgi:type IV pilus assembly protein PilY1
MVESLRRAFANITAELQSSSAAVAANSTRLESDTAVFQATFDSTNWSGDLLAFPITDEGDIESDSACSVAQNLDAQSNVFMEFSRNVLTNDPLSDTGATSDGELLASNGKPFLWGSLTPGQQDLLRQTEKGTPVVVADGQDRLNYLRGDDRKEQTSENTSLPFRLRDSRMGDIVNSNPQFIHQQDFGYGSLNLQPGFTDIDSYGEFRAETTYQERVPLLVVGSNDGMLHGFNADVTAEGNGGDELFAYVPSAIMGNLYELTSPDYEHRYYVDGTPRVADAWLGTTLGWSTLAVGTTGAGGNSVFAIDVTDPSNVGNADVLWEFSHPEMGLTQQQPAIVALASGEFGVVVTSGYDTGEDDGRVWVLNASTGRPIETFTLTGSGELGSPLVVDLTGDRIADRIYLGDTDGKLWRIDIDDSNENQWGIPSALSDGPLFDAGTDQPITAPLASAFNEKREHMVYFGTGSFFKEGDNVVENDPEIQSFYGIIDSGIAITKSNLLEQEILARPTVNGQGLSVVSNNELTSQSGWYIDLVYKESLGGNGADGERVTARALIRGDRVIFTSLIPSENPCEAGGDSRLYEVDSFSGSRLAYSVFDLNNDGKFDENDFVEIEVDGETVRVPVSAIDSEIGIINTPSVLTGVGEGNDERKIISGSSGQMISIPEAGSATRGRQNWEQVR